MNTSLHILFAACWMALALAIGIKTALVGNEEAALAKQRGADLKARYELVAQNSRLRAYIDWQSSPPILAEVVRRLELPLGPSSSAKSDDLNPAPRRRSQTAASVSTVAKR